MLLSEENKRQFFIPRGFAHGFAVLSEEAVFTYKVDNKYAPQAEASILYNDETLGIDWPLADSQMVLSAKDREGTAYGAYLLSTLYVKTASSLNTAKP